MADLCGNIQGVIRIIASSSPSSSLKIHHICYNVQKGRRLVAYGDWIIDLKNTQLSHLLSFLLTLSEGGNVFFCYDVNDYWVVSVFFYKQSFKLI